MKQDHRLACLSLTTRHRAWRSEGGSGGASVSTDSLAPRRKLRLSEAGHPSHCSLLSHGDLDGSMGGWWKTDGCVGCTTDHKRCCWGHHPRRRVASRLWGAQAVGEPCLCLVWPPLLEGQDKPPCPAPRILSEWADAGPSGLHPASVTCSVGGDLIQATHNLLVPAEASRSAAARHRQH